MKTEGESIGSAVVRDMASDMDADRLIEEFEKTRREDVRDAIKKEISKRDTCPECENDVLFDEKNQKMYCPLGHYERQFGDEIWDTIRGLEEKTS